MGSACCIGVMCTHFVLQKGGHVLKCIEWHKLTVCHNTVCGAVMDRACQQSLFVLIWEFVYWHCLGLELCDDLQWRCWPEYCVRQEI
jgi:hypothetical protein